MPPGAGPLSSQRITMSDYGTYMIEIDGSYGEGGGQIVRTALSLSCLFQKPFRIFNIRKNRSRPGLKPQHLTCVKAAQQITGADVSGDHQESAELVFSPGSVRSGSFSFDIGTAGSTSLVLQTLIPALAFSGHRSMVTLTGGTHVPFSPSYHYLSEVFMPFLERIGVHVKLSLDYYGFYPRGGGRIRAEILPAKRVNPLVIPERGNFRGLFGHSGVGNLPLSIAERQRSAFLSRTMAVLGNLHVPAAIDVLEASTPGRGTFIDVVSMFDHAAAGFTGLGKIGRKAEAVGEEAAGEFIAYFSSGATTDRHMADQIVLYLSLCDRESFFSASAITSHLLTNLWVISLFHEVRYSLEGDIGEKGNIRLKGTHPFT